MKTCLLTGLVVAATSLAIGCSGANDDDDAKAIAQALEEENGGMSTQAEAPSFGDPSLDMAAPIDETSGDEADGEVDLELAKARVFRLALLWGNLPMPKDGIPNAAPTPADFSGSLSVDRGGIAVSRTLKFDDGDHLEPRTSRREVSFVSHTLPRVDGLIVSVRIPEGAPTVVHFETATVSTDIDLSKLDSTVGNVVRAGDGQNGVSYLGFEDDKRCKSGFVVGRWKHVKSHLGKFHGRIIGDKGALHGHVKGVFGRSRKAGAEVFFGKAIDRSGDFRGLIGGRLGEGELTGRWGTPHASGKLEAMVTDGYVERDGRGLFLGRFQEKCE